MKKRKTVFVRSVWVMLSIFFTLLFAFFTVATVVLPNISVINDVLGINLYQKVQTGDGTEDMEYFKSDFPKKNADGSIQYVTETSGDNKGYTHQVYDHKAMRANSEKVAEQTAVEGSVLLWNENDAGEPVLPLAQNAGVSVYGMGAYNYVYLGNGSGGMSLDPKEGSLSVALRNKGIAVNSRLNTTYLSLLNKYGRKLGNYGADKNYLPWFSVNEAPWSEVEAVTNESIASYNDAAIMVVSRTAGEDYDISTAEPPENATDGNGNKIDKEVYLDGRNNYLELTREEGEILEQLNQLKQQGKLKSIVLLLNTANPMQFANIVKEQYGVDACVWVGMGGTMSYVQLADVLAGHDEYVVSGHATDTLVYDSFSAPSYANFGDFDWTNLSELSGKLPDFDKEYGAYYQTHNYKYMIYQEGVYVGYRYYETRYEDYVLGSGNVGDYDYSETVAFPFGYGSSYTEFTHSDYNVVETDDAYQVSMKITNVGEKYAGKDVLQVYMQRPYTEHDKQFGIEKPAVELVGFAKTDLLAPNGGNQTLTVTIDKENMRTYDAYDQKTYILEAGDYYIAAGTDAHDALNNILAVKATSEQKTRMDAEGDAQFVYKDTVAADDYEIYSVSEESGEEVKITNRFDDADINLYEGAGDQKVTYLSRSDWTGTFPTEAYKLACATDKMIEDMQYGTDEVVAPKEGDEMPVYGKVTAPEGELTLAMMIELDYGDEKWQDLLNQMTLDEQQILCSYGLLTMAGAESVAAPGSKATDGPGGVKNNNPEAGQQFGFPSPVVMAQTWDTDLIEDLGVAFAHEGLHLGIYVFYAPGANIHRSPYSGRNWEYYSEDGVLSGSILCAEIKGMQSKGIMVMTKHFAFNDQERNRYGVATFFNEQSAREIYLRPFEIAVREGDMNGVMSSFNRVGCTWAGAHKGLLTDVLRNEWGFVGIVETDSCTGNTYHMGTKYAKAEGLLAGNDLWMYSQKDANYFGDWEDNPTVMLALREACHRILYTQLHSAAMNGMSTSTRIIKIMPWYQVLLLALAIVFGVLALAAITLAVLSFVFASEKYKNYMEAKAAAAERAKAEAAHSVRRTGGNVVMSSDGDGYSAPSDGGSDGGDGFGKSWLTPKRKKIIAIVVAAVAVVAIVLVSVLVPLNCNGEPASPETHVCEHKCEICGKCTDPDCDDPVCADKCPGHEPAAHECESVCPECGKCLDLQCEDPACAEKCNDGRTAYIFEAEDSEIKDGTASYAKYNIRTDNGRTYVADLNQNYGATLTFTIIAEEATTASLGITITRRNIDTVFTDKFSVSVNGGRDLVRPVTIPAYADQWAASSFMDFNLGCIDLNAGENTIIFTVATPGDMSGYNFDRITLYSEKALSAPHVCDSVCPICGKCTDLECDDPVCAEKCPGHENIVTLDGVTQSKWGIGMKGGNPALPNKSGNVVGNLSENLGASLTFEFTAAEAGKAQLIAAVTTRDKEYKFTDVFTVNVNDGEALVSEAMIPTTGSNEWYTTTEVSLGEIDVVKGVNKVVFTVATASSAMGVNFGYMKVEGATGFVLSSHVCDSVCEDCGKCTDATCEGLGCEEKCEDYVSVTYKGTEATLGEGKNGTAKPETIRDGLMGNISGNTGATLTYTYTAASAGTVSLYVGVTQRNVELTFKDEMTVTVNGEEFAISDSVKVPALSTNNWYDCIKIDLGDITVNEGANTIIFTVTESTMGFNFGYVMFVAAK